MKIPLRKKARKISRRFTRSGFGEDFLTRATALRRRALQLGLFVSSLPAIYFGTAAYQVRLTDHGWMVTERGSKVALRVCVRKIDAVRETKKMARENRAQLDIFTRQGSLQAHESFV